MSTNLITIRGASWSAKQAFRCGAAAVRVPRRILLSLGTRARIAASVAGIGAIFGSIQVLRPVLHRAAVSLAKSRWPMPWCSEALRRWLAEDWFSGAAVWTSKIQTKVMAFPHFEIFLKAGVGAAILLHLVARRKGAQHRLLAAGCAVAVLVLVGSPTSFGRIDAIEAWTTQQISAIETGSTTTPLAGFDARQYTATFAGHVAPHTNVVLAVTEGVLDKGVALAVGAAALLAGGVYLLLSLPFVAVPALLVGLSVLGALSPGLLRGLVRAGRKPLMAAMWVWAASKLVYAFSGALLMGAHAAVFSVHSPLGVTSVLAGMVLAPPLVVEIVVRAAARLIDWSALQKGITSAPA